MPRGRGGGGGFGPDRKDYALLRDGATLEHEEDVESNAGKKQGSTVLRLLGLAKEEWLVSLLPGMPRMWSPSDSDGNKLLPARGRNLVSELFICRKPTATVPASDAEHMLAR